MSRRSLFTSAATCVIAGALWLPAVAVSSPEPTADTTATTTTASTSTPTPTSTPSPTPTHTPTSSPTPSPTASPTPTPCPEPSDPATSDDTDETDETSTLTSTVGSVIGDAIDMVTPDTEDSETDAAQCAGTATPTPEPTSEAGTGDESSDEGETDDGAASADGQEEPEMPADATPTEQRFLGTPADAPVVSANPGQLTGSRITMYGLSYEGVVELPTPEGTIEVMEFTMDSSTTDDFSLAVVDDDGSSSVTGTAELTIEGDVTFHTTRFEGTLLGFRWTFLPETPPPFTLPIMTFGDPEIELVAVEANILETEPVMRQAMGS